MRPRMRLRLISYRGSIAHPRSVRLLVLCYPPRLALTSVILVMGHPYDPAIDIWSIGCTLYELYTGKILFPGRTNNHMLLLMMELKGRFNTKTIKRAKFGDMYFDDLGAFLSVEQDRVTGSVRIFSYLLPRVRFGSLSLHSALFSQPPLRPPTGRGTQSSRHEADAGPATEADATELREAAG